MITDEIRGKIIEAMKVGDKLRVETLKLLSSAFTNAEIAKKREKLNEEEEIKIVKSEVKKRQDAIELYEKGGAKDKAEKEKKEIKILQEYLPEQINDQELEKIVEDAIKEVGASPMADMGKVIGVVMKKVGSTADGNRVSSLVKKKLS
jgi:uncharacterized protein YqeY